MYHFRKHTTILSVIIALCLTYLWGIFTVRHQIFPYKPLKTVYYTFNSLDSPSKRIGFTEPTINIDSIKRSFLDVRLKRRFLQDSLLAPRELFEIQKEYRDNKAKIQATVYGISSTAILTKAAKSNSKCLRIYLQGHGGNPFDFSYHNKLLDKFTENGCDTLSMSMIGIGLNKGSAHFPTRFGLLTLSAEEAENHGNYSFFYDEKNPKLDPVALFVAPQYYMIKEILGDYRDIATIGISGGGWSAIFLGALIPEIHTTISYAGSLPFEYRKFKENRGDWEQVYSRIYEHISYWDLYYMSVLDGDFGTSRETLNKSVFQTS